MKFWLCKHSEPLPIKSDSRKFRMGMVSEALRSRGHEVTWWTSTMDHGKKKKYEPINVLPNGTNAIMLDGISYERNVSLQRVINHWQVGKQFSSTAGKMDVPNLILVAMPTLDFAYRAIRYAKENDVPVVVDIRDLWPDVFLDLIPIKKLRKDQFLLPWNKKLKYVLKYSDVIIGITQEYLEWALDKANISYDSRKHKVFPIGYNQVKLEYENPFKNDSFQITFTGTVGYHFDLETVFKAAELLKDQDISLNILGDGDLLKSYKTNYGHLNNVNFFGWVDGSEISAYLLYSDLGIAPYNNTPNFVRNIANKPYEYMAHSLPIITCLSGATEKLIRKHDLGYFYESNNPESLANQIKLIKSNKKDLQRKTVKNERAFNKYYNSEIVYSNMVEFLESLALVNKPNIA